MKRVLGLSGAVLLGAMVASCTGPQGAAGKPGTDGTNGKDGSGSPSVSAVTPESAFLARTVDVTISGSGTAWATKATVDFGDPKIKVNKVTVASATGLVVNITVATDAAVGPHDVKVTDDAGGSETFKGAFSVVSPLKVDAGGSLAQGSVNPVHVRGLDFTTPFDTTSVSTGPFSPPTFTNVTVTTLAGINASVDNVADYTVDYTLFVDVMTPAATTDVSIQSGPTADTIDFPSKGSIPIAARAPKAVTAGTAASGMIAKLGDSALFSYTPGSAALKIIDLSVGSTDANAGPAAYFLPKSGKFADVFAAAAANTQAISNTDPFFLVAVDGNGYAGYAVSVTAVETPATGVAEKEPNQTLAQAVTNGLGTAPWVIQGATLSADTDVDTYAIKITAADVGKKLWVQTTGLDRKVDTVIDILDTTGASTLGGPSDDSGYLDTLLSSALATAGTYYVQVSASSQGFFSVTHNKYDLIIRLQ